MKILGTKVPSKIKYFISYFENCFAFDYQLYDYQLFTSYYQLPDQSRLTTIAKSIMKICKEEMSEIENCHSCYLNANTKDDWFTEVCPKPHLLVWAKLKGE